MNGSICDKIEKDYQNWEESKKNKKGLLELSHMKAKHKKLFLSQFMGLKNYHIIS